MLTLLTIIGVIILGVILFVLGVGLFLFLGIFLVIGVVALVISSFFGGINWSSRSSSNGPMNLFSNNDATEVIEGFQSCLMESDPDPCRAKFTLWDEKDKDLIRQLSKQLKDELGKRSGEGRNVNYKSNWVNGHQVVEIDQNADFEKKKEVREHYVLESDPKDDDILKIKDLNWDY